MTNRHSQHKQVKRRQPQGLVRTLAGMLILLIALFIQVPSAFATGTLTLDLNAINPATNQPITGTIQVGQPIEYVIDFSCSGITGDCGALTITFPLDSEVSFQEIIAPPGYTATYDAVNHEVTITRTLFADAEAGQVTVRVQVGEELDDLRIDAEIEGTISNGSGGGTQTIQVPGAPITIEEPDGDWTTNKVQTSPPGGLGPISGGEASYTVSACATLGAERLETVTIVDHFPPGAIPSNYGAGVPGDEFDAAGVHVSDPLYAGPDGVLDTITWEFNFPAPNYHTYADGCISVSYDLEYPVADFPTGTPIPNNYMISATTPDDPFPDNGPCPNCMGTGGTGGQIDAPSVTASTSKSGPGTSAVIAPAAPGNNDGITPFTLGWGLGQANTSTDNFVVTDIFPLANGETRPIIDVVELHSGAWDGGYAAVWEYQDSAGNWNLLSNLTGTNVTLYSPADFPVPIYGVRWRFTDTLPAGFNPSGAPVIWFTVPSGLNSSAYDDGGNPRTYQNCATFGGTFQDENDVTQNITASSACANFRVGEDLTDGYTNITTGKSANPAEAFPEQDIQFTLNINLTQEASGALINPFIEDVLPYGLQIVSVDSVTFTNTVPGDVTPNPYLRVEQVVNGGTHPIGGGSVDLQRLVFFWSDTAPDSISFPVTPNSGTFACTTFPCEIDDDINDFALTGGAPSASGQPANALNISAPDQNNSKTVEIRFTARARRDTPSGDNNGNNIGYDNNITIVTDSTNLVCQDQAPPFATDVNDINEDGIIGSTVCSTSGSYSIREAAQIAGSKWIRSVDGPFDFVDSGTLNTSTACPTTTYDTNLSVGGPSTFTRFPCVAQGRIGGDLEYLMRLQNTGLTHVDDLILYDILAHEGDIGVSQAISGETRDSQFRVFLTNPVVWENSADAWVATNGFTLQVEYFIGATNTTSPYTTGTGSANPYNPYRPQMSSIYDSPLLDWSGSGLADGSWVLAGGVADWSLVTSFRIRQTGGAIPPGAQLVFSAPGMISAEDDPFNPALRNEAETGEIGWNSFAHRYSNAFSDRRLLTAAPRKVGILVEEVYSVGNRVWIDEGGGTGLAGDGILNGTEVGVNGVVVELWQRTGGGNWTLYATDTTRSDTVSGDDGYYFFGNLDGGTNVDYLVHIPAQNFAAGGGLENYISSNYTGANNNSGAYNAGQGNNRVDSRDNGRNPANLALYTDTSFAGNGLPNGGVSTQTFQLTRRNQSTVDSDTNTDNTNPDGSPPTNEGPYGRGENHEADNYSDLTRDFGFHIPMSIGNRVWRDDGADSSASGGFDLSQYNDGIMNGDEVGIGGVTVQLWRDTNGDGTPDTQFATTITDSDGYYLFDGLPQGVYEVRIVTSQTPLNGLVNSYPALTPDATNPDSVNRRRPADSYDAPTIHSPIINLTLGNQPTNETDMSSDTNAYGPDGWGRWDEFNQNSDLTIDFGFLPVPMSLGNLVWIDDGADAAASGGFNPTQFDDGIFNGDEVGVANVIVNLYFASAPNDIIATDFTDAGGYYLFDYLVPENYIVEIAPENFASTGWTGNTYDGVGTDPGPLYGHFSSTGVTPPSNNAADNHRDHGIDQVDPATTGIRTGTITLATNTAPVNETGEGNTSTSNDVAGQPISDNNSNLTIDLGFVRPVALGNRVWLDNERVESTLLPGDGIRQSTEAGIDGVLVELWTANPDGTRGTLIASTTTANGGYYLFDRQGNDQTDDTAARLGQGDYIVHIPASNFATGQPLEGLISSDNGNPTTVTDGSQVNTNVDSVQDAGDEDGLNLTEGDTTTYPINAGTSTGVIAIRYDQEPVAEVDRDPARPTFNGRDVQDGDSNLTIDLGFYQPPLSIGNFVWIDDGRTGGAFDVDTFIPANFGNGIFDAGETGVAGVVVNLYTADGSGNPVEAANAPIATTTTDANGYYLFDNLPPGDYIVAIAAENFATGGLQGYGSSIYTGTGATDGAYTAPTVNNDRLDNRDNGIDNPEPATGYGIRSHAFPLDYFAEPANEVVTDLSGNPVHGPDFIGRYGEKNYNSNMTIDFGVVRYMSLGNRVWLDDGAGGGTNDNGIMDGTEVGIANVNVSLYRFIGADPTTPFDATDAANFVLVDTTTTDAEGFYLFDGLAPDDYVVWVDAVNFQAGGALEDYDSSYDGEPPTFPHLPTDGTGNTANQTTDKGIDENLPAYNGVASRIVELRYDDEPTTDEVDLPSNTAANIDAYGPNMRGRNNETNANSNLYLDFGFDAPRHSVGNFVWYDYNNNGLFDGMDAPVAGVVVRLYNSTGNNPNGSGIPATPITSPLMTTTTDANGYYLFDNLPAGDYVVWIDALNFREGEPLFEFYSSTGDYSDPTVLDPSGNTRDDTRDNGVDNANPAVNGIFSTTIPLYKNESPMGETDLSGNPAHGNDGEWRGNQQQIDSNSDLTRDFGFYKPMSLGNRVWFDSNSDGLISPGESGIGNVQLQLWEWRGTGTPPDTFDLAAPGDYVLVFERDADGNPTIPYVQTTDVNGYYLFSNLPPATYQVVIPGGQASLAGLSSTIDDVNVTTPTDRNRIDNNDNGIGTGPTTDPIFSGPITLVLDNEPTNESDIGPQGIGTHGETNRNSNLTVDFGFVGQLMSLGNRVWFDPDNNGVIDAGETGINGVTVSLYRDNNNDGIPDGPAIATTITADNGYYLFDNLAPGRYIVGLNNSNFSTGQPLNGLISSTGAFGDPVTDVGGTFTRDDNRDNGLDVIHATYGLISTPITLVANSAPENEHPDDIVVIGGIPQVGANGSNENSDLTRDFGLYRPMSLGNRVWYDLNDDGLHNPSETGIPNVDLELYRFIGTDPTVPFDPSDTTNFVLVDTTSTDTNGYYLFDGLGQGDYIVYIPPTNFAPGDVLDGLANSTPIRPDPLTGETVTDRNNNGVDEPDPVTNGIRSNLITMTPNTSPTGEADLSGNPVDGPNSRGNNGETDNNSNLTIDFGFVPPSMSLGNRVWIDEGAGGNYYNGILDGDEIGVDGVEVRLYFANPDGTPNGAPIATTTTTGGGYYLFDGLTPGDYVVQLSPSNFTGAGVLTGYGSTITTANGSTPVGTDADDDRNNGLQGSSPEVNGIYSALVTLELGQAPLNEAGGVGPQGPGANGVDGNSNLTIDFGVFRPLSIGNRVWYDNGSGTQTNNGLQDAGELGIANVQLELWIPDASGAPSTPYQVSDGAGGFIPYTTTTDSQGYYIFDGLPPGDYVVVIPPSNFAGTGSLVGMTNSEPIRPDVLTGETNVDRNNNGVDEADPITNGIQSNVISLTLNSLPTNETDLSGNALAHGPNFRGRNGEANNNSNLTVDFGFFPADGSYMSIGNRVWLDDGIGGGGFNNGTHDGTEAGIAGVTVQLYHADASGNPVGAQLGQTITDGDGYYLFDNLDPGNYVVVIPATNFNTSTAPLYGLLSSTGDYTTGNSGGNRDDRRDNGIDVLNPGTTGVRSGLIQLILHNTATGETDLAQDTNGNDIMGANDVDDNSNMTIDFGFVPQYDLGDAPDDGAIFTFPNGNPADYGTTDANNGPRHRIVPDLYIGAIVDAEPDGQPSVGADGDGADEDGVSFPPLTADAPADVEVTVFNNTGRDAHLIGWIDFDGSGTFDPSEAVVVTIPSSPSPQTVILPFYVPQGADLPTATGGETYARFRLTTDPSIFDASGDPLPTGLVNDGEIEDYRVPLQSPGISINKTNGQNAIVVGQQTTYTVTIRNSASGIPIVNRLFEDNLPPEFLPGSVSWTCNANTLASCITGQPGGTDLSGAGNPSLNLDLEPGGEIIILITATLDPNLIPTSPNQTVINEALFMPDRAIDETGIIFDPPDGTKIGVVVGQDVIRWTMDWRNTGNIEFATVTDVLQPNQTFAGNLLCTPYGASTTATCSYDPATRTVSWSGDIGTGFANRVLISFDVTVPGPGTYTNTGTISQGGDTRTSTGNVNIPGDPTDPSPFRLDPTIVKLVDPILAQPGELVTWTISVINPHDSPLTNVGFTDIMPPEFTIIATDPSAGTVTVSGQQINFFIDPLAAHQTVTIRVLTQVRADVVPPFVATNLVTLDDPYRGEDSATVTGVGELPATGETPLWATWVRFWLDFFK